jgi:hypothetical protein
MSRSNLPVIQVAYKGHTKRQYFVTWNGRKYAARDVKEMNGFAAWMKGNKAERRTIIEL